MLPYTSYLGIHRLQNLSNLVLVTFDEKKCFSTQRLSLITLARTCMSHDDTPQEKTFHQSSLACHLLERINDKYQGTTILQIADLTLGFIYSTIDSL